jgi:hypothetical protein
MAFPFPLAILALHQCELPCWIGIVPGQTTLGQAQQLLKSAYPSPEYTHTANYNPYVDMNWLTITQVRDGVSFSLNFNEDQAAAQQTEETIVTQMTISSKPGSGLTLGDWSSALGKPQALSVTWGSHWAAPNALYYRHGIRLTLDSGGNLDVKGWHVFADTVTLYADLHRAYPLTYTIPWRGWTGSYEDSLRALMMP